MQSLDCLLITKSVTRRVSKILWKSLVQFWLCCFKNSFFHKFWWAVLMLNQVMVHQWWGHLRMYPSSIVVLVYINKFTNQPDTLKRILLHWLDNYFLALISDGVRTAVFATFILSLPNSICKIQIKYVLSTTIWALRLAVVRSKYWWDMESNEKFYIRKAFH